KNDVNKRAELCDTMATRSPCSTPRASSPAACARATRATSFHVSSPSDSAGWSGSSTIPTRSPYTSSARSMKSSTVIGTRMSDSSSCRRCADRMTCARLDAMATTNIRLGGDAPPALLFLPSGDHEHLPLVLLGHGAHLSKDDPVMQILAKGLCRV